MSRLLNAFSRRGFIRSGVLVAGAMTASSDVLAFGEERPSSETSPIRLGMARRCQQCGAMTSLEIHHKEFRGQSGDDSELFAVPATITSTVELPATLDRCERDQLLVGLSGLDRTSHRKWGKRDHTGQAKKGKLVGKNVVAPEPVEVKST
jgi:hypothetical protein